MSGTNYSVGRFSTTPAKIDADRDVRGILWMFEQPQPYNNYVISCDPTYGIEGWSRDNRSRDDMRTDNGAICVLRKGRAGEPDVQVAEYAAPKAPFELADDLNFIGRLYAGNSEESQAYCIIEVYPGPGLILHREMVNRFGYQNFYMHRYLTTMSPQQTRYPGFYSNRQSVSDLWIKGKHYINNGGVRILSPWLVEEMADCSWDMQRNRGFAVGGGVRHDDRVTALLLALWAANQWNVAIAPSENGVVEVLEQPGWQCSDISADDMLAAWSERVGTLGDE